MIILEQDYVERITFTKVGIHELDLKNIKGRFFISFL